VHGLGLHPGVGPRAALVYGGGLLGLYACSLFQEEGFQVYLSDPMESRREQAAMFGAVGVVGDQVRERTYDVVLEVCGVGAVVRQGLEVLRPGGVIVLVGCVTPGTELQLTGEGVVRRCATLVGVHNYSGGDLREAVAFLERTQHKDQLRSLVSPPLPLSQFGAALALAQGGAYQRVLLDCTK